MKYALVYDGKILYFNDEKSAMKFRDYHIETPWKLIIYYLADVPSAEKQKRAIRFVEIVLQIKFTGSINSKNQCHEFLSTYLDIAKQTYQELKSDYEADRGYQYCRMDIK